MSDPTGAHRGVYGVDAEAVVLDGLLSLAGHRFPNPLLEPRCPDGQVRGEGAALGDAERGSP